MKVNCTCKKGQTAQVIVGNHDVIAYCTKCESWQAKRAAPCSA